MNGRMIPAGAMALCLALAACSGERPVIAALEAASQPGYTLAPGDKLHIIVVNETTITGDYQISARGGVDLPLIGPVQARGLEAEGLAAAIRARLADGYVKDPRVSVEVRTYRPYYILGEVNRPGEYPYAVDITVQQAVAGAGGYTYRANTGTVFIRRSDQPQEYKVSLKGASVYVRAGDTLRIGERYF